MHYLFILVLTSASAFSIFLYMSPIVINPLAYVLLGWASAVGAYYLHRFWDILRLWGANRTFECFIITPEGLVWDGKVFSREGTPWILFNNVQIEDEVKKIIRITDDRDFYIRILPPREEEELTSDDF